MSDTIRIPREETDVTPPAAPWTILLIEDDSQLRETVRLLLQAMGHAVYAADSEAQARFLWRRHGPDVDVLLTDMMIPTRTTGTALAREFRADRPSLRVILTSGFGPEIAEDDPCCPPRLVFLQKPFTSSTLQTALEKVFT